MGARRFVLRVLRSGVRPVRGAGGPHPPERADSEGGGMSEIVDEIKDEDLPVVKERPGRLVWIDGLQSDRHTNRLTFVDPLKGDYMELNEERVRRIVGELREIV